MTQDTALGGATMTVFFKVERASGAETQYYKVVDGDLQKGENGEDVLVGGTTVEIDQQEYEENA